MDNRSESVLSKKKHRLGTDYRAFNEIRKNQMSYFQRFDQSILTGPIIVACQWNTFDE
jgi:hypothetical protein